MDGGPATSPQYSSHLLIVNIEERAGPYITLGPPNVLLECRLFPPLPDRYCSCIPPCSRKTAVAVVLAAAVRTAAGSTAARWDDGRRLNNSAPGLDGGDRRVGVDRVDGRRFDGGPSERRPPSQRRHRVAARATATQKETIHRRYMNPYTTGS